ncbi:arginase family protein [Terrimonas sp. NA20]|uniref:Arginase family protein n=1 Tax=Terrimonas ginsenosidimutans TaxID=2908004 RepID=A0ABS9KQB1_9BACT|nr:arginase family protein [Terrimonas ginsenosidimutans]MCG2614512.1 arginase family protein [Terrimonas ginsenosidimutans]
MSPVVILEFPSNLGLKAPSPGHEPGVRKLPSWLKQHQFHSLINPSATITLEPPPYTMLLDKASGVRNADAIIEYAKKQANLLQEVIESNSFALILGGDCSILIGNAVSLKRIGRYGLFYLDGHHDFMLPALSGTGGAAGMDTAIVTGHGHEKLTDIGGLKPYFNEQHVWCIGNREYDTDYVRPVLESSIHYQDLIAFRKQGANDCVNDFFSMVESEKLDGFLIHLDVDVLDDDVMPAVDSRTTGGITYAELDAVLLPLLRSGKAVGLEITILDPELDPAGLYTKQFVEQFCRIFNDAMVSVSQ